MGILCGMVHVVVRSIRFTMIDACLMKRFVTMCVFFLLQVHMHSIDAYLTHTDYP